MLLIKIEPNQDGIYHELHEREGATENFMGDGWLIVPDELHDEVWECVGCCDLIIENDELVGIVAKERPIPPEPPEPEPYTNSQEFITGMMEGVKNGN